VRVPAAIWWLGQLEASVLQGVNNRIEQPITVSDVLPTILQAIGEEDGITDDLAGRSHGRRLLGEPEPSPDYAVSDIFQMLRSIVGGISSLIEKTRSYLTSLKIRWSAIPWLRHALIRLVS
jgi:hypothetical protein